MDYTYLDVGNVTSWTSRGAGVWPTTDEIKLGQCAIHTDGTGAELSAVPCLAYANAGSHSGDLNYYFAVIPAKGELYSRQILESYVRSTVLPDTVPPSAPTVRVTPDVYTSSDSVTVEWTGRSSTAR